MARALGRGDSRRVKTERRSSLLSPSKGQSWWKTDPVVQLHVSLIIRPSQSEKVEALQITCSGKLSL